MFLLSLSLSPLLSLNLSPRPSLTLSFLSPVNLIGSIPLFVFTNLSPLFFRLSIAVGLLSLNLSRLIDLFESNLLFDWFILNWFDWLNRLLPLLRLAEPIEPLLG